MGDKTRARETFSLWRAMAALTQSLSNRCEVSLIRSSPAARQKSSTIETLPLQTLRPFAATP